MNSDLRAAQQKIDQCAKNYGLTFFPINYEVVSYEMMSELAAKTGFPDRYPHWSFGMEYEKLSKSYEYGLSKIYEMVINTNPCYAYLLEGNSMIDQKTVMAHVCGHADFFKNNFAFRGTDLDGGKALNPASIPTDYNPNRKWIEKMSSHGQRIRKIVDRYGIEKVEQFIDYCLRIDELIDIQEPFTPSEQLLATKDYNDEPVAIEVPKFAAKDYMDDFINPKEYIEEQKRKLEEKAAAPKKVPEKPQRDVLAFLIKYAPLENWEMTILQAMRDEAYYFLPQWQTKIMNEGWATFIESHILTKCGVFDSSEIIDYADSYSMVTATNGKSLNPYKLGVELLRDIEDRWNRGAFGPEYNDCDDIQARQNWNMRLGLGKEKLFQVRSCYTDVMFIDEFLTPEFCIEQKLFAFDWSNRNDRYEVATREFAEIKNKLLFQLTNGGRPIINVDDGNFDNRGELLLKHDHQGQDLRKDYVKEVLVALVRIWKRPVSVRTVVDEQECIVRFDGTEHTMRNIR